MTAMTLQQLNNSNIVVHGDMTFAAMDKKIPHSFGFLGGHKQITIDLGKVGSTDSAGLALMLEWTKHARSKRVQLHFINVPRQIVNLAKLSSLDLSNCGISN